MVEEEVGEVVGKEDGREVLVCRGEVLLVRLPHSLGVLAGVAVPHPPTPPPLFESKGVGETVGLTEADEVMEGGAVSEPLSLALPWGFLEGVPLGRSGEGLPTPLLSLGLALPLPTALPP